MMMYVQVLRVVNEAPSPSLVRKSPSYRRSQQGLPSFLDTDDHGETFLQVGSLTRLWINSPARPVVGQPPLS
jgi:hypothetical protein